MRVFKSLSQREYFSHDQGDLPDFLKKPFSSLPDEVIQPGTPEEAIQAVKEAYAANIPVVPRGIASTAFGQVIPINGGKVVDLCFLKGIVSLDASGLLVTVQSGVRWSDLSAYLDEKGLAIGSHPSSWYSTIGGWVATGGIGLNTLKFGHLKSQIEELRVCIEDGKEAVLTPGDELFDAFFETEGQMGLVLEVTLQVRPKPEGSYPFLVCADSIGEAWQLSREAMKANFDLTHASVYNMEKMKHLSHALTEKMQKQGSQIAFQKIFELKPSVLFHLENEEKAADFEKWLSESGKSPAPSFQASFVWNERFYPLKGKKAESMFLGNEVVIANKEAASYTEKLGELASRKNVLLSIESNAASAEESVVISSFYVQYNNQKDYLKGLAFVFEMDDLACRHKARLYHVGIYNTPFIHRRFSRDQFAKLARAKKIADPKGLFNPGKFFKFSPRNFSFLPGWFVLLGARLSVGIVKTRPGELLFQKLLSVMFPEKEMPQERFQDLVFKTARECVSCGFCLPVCPAYLATRDERTTARGKLFLASMWLSGGKLESEDVELLHSCMHCAGCTRVCTSSLDLVPAWYELESRVAREHGKPQQAIENFVHDVEESQDYKRLLRQGFILEEKVNP